MKKVFLILSIVMVICGLVLGGCSEPEPSPAPTPEPSPAPTPNPTPTESEKNVTLRLQHGLNPGQAEYTFAENFKEQVEKASNGSITVEIYPNGQLVKDAEMSTALPAGVVDMGVCLQTAGWPNLIPELNFMMVMGLFDNFAHVDRFAMGEYRDIISEKYSKTNVKLLGFIYNGPLDTHFNSKKMIKLPEDVVGLKLRVANATAVDAVEAMGGAGVIMPSTETYQSIQRGTVDGIFGTTAGIGPALKMYEVAYYWTRMPVSEGYRYALLMNLDIWNSLSQNQQSIITEAADNYQNEVVAGVLAQNDTMWETVAAQPNVEVYVTPDADIAKFLTIMRPSSLKFLTDNIPAENMALYEQMVEEAR